MPYDVCLNVCDKYVYIYMQYKLYEMGCKRNKTI